MNFPVPAALGRYLYLSGLAVFQYLALLAIFTQILFFAGFPVHPATIVVALIPVLLSLIHITGQESPSAGTEGGKMWLKARTLVPVLIITIILLLVSVGIAISFIDTSHDSNTYHKPYSLFLVHGWNPVLNETPPVVFGIQGEDYMENTFPKAAEILGAFVYLGTGILESVKAINYIIILPAVVLIYHAFILFLPGRRWIAGILSLTAVFSPIWITQSTQFYIDGFLYQVLVCIIALMLIYVKERGGIPVLSSILLGLVLLLNIKGSALLFVPVLVAMFCTMLWLYHRDGFVRIVIPFLAILLALSLVTGFSPYLAEYTKYSTEFSVYLDPFGMNHIIEDVDGTRSDPSDRPGPNTRAVHGKDVQGTGAGKDPGGLLPTQVSRILYPRELFIRSLFSPVTQEYTGMKNPFLVNPGEVRNLTGENRINAYGPFLGLMVILTLLLAILLLYYHRDAGTDAGIIAICCVFLLASVVLHPALWCGRYVPQFYLLFTGIPLIGFIIGKPLLKVCATLIILVLVVNALLVGVYWYADSLERTGQISELLDSITESADGPVLIRHSADATRKDIADSSYRLAVIALFEERKIPWIYQEEETNQSPGYTVPLFFETDAVVVPKSREYQIGDTIPASRIGRYATRGFAPTFGSHIWTDRNETELNLTISDPPENLYLVITARPFHTGSRCIDQTIWVTMNGKTFIMPESFEGCRISTIVLPVPSGLVREGTNIISFYLPDAVRLPKGEYGLSVTSVALTPVIPADTGEEKMTIGERICSLYPA